MSTDDIPDTELLNIPSDNLNLSRLFTIRSGLLHEKLLDELASERAGTARPFMLFDYHDPKRMAEEERRRALQAYEAAMQDVRDHADRILLRIDEQQRDIEKRKIEMDGRALHLHDGRRFWRDGDRYRDDDGYLLEGRDDAEAHEISSRHPDVPTWTDREKLREEAERTKELKDKVLAEREGQGNPQDAENRLNGYEKDLQAQIEERSRDVPKDYGDPDYASLLSSQGPFNAAAAGEEAAVVADKTDTEETKKAPRPFAFRPS